jgi:hypothetical protein
VPLLPFRLGYADRPARPTPRRPVDEVLHEPEQRKQFHQLGPWWLRDEEGE